VIVVSNSSPLITLARIGQLELLSSLYGSILIPAEVHDEVIVNGAGLPGANSVAGLSWLTVRRLADPGALVMAQSLFGLGAGELAAILLAQELHSDLVLLDEVRARRFARGQGLRVRGCVGILEAFLLWAGNGSHARGGDRTIQPA
jgi:predicted nucleic acid-binding protein